ncbi:hypothetical protein SDC9_193129 [bioreactor metagenome]|uniref:Uncharacterized protein n=1 Tax=bioreactor metagenome TaxID=1076179 RepID=A0A645I467_9ZZZZ
MDLQIFFNSCKFFQNRRFQIAGILDEFYRISYGQHCVGFSWNSISQSASVDGNQLNILVVNPGEKQSPQNHICISETFVDVHSGMSSLQTFDFDFHGHSFHIFQWIFLGRSHVNSSCTTDIDFVVFFCIEV